MSCEEIVDAKRNQAGRAFDRIIGNSAALESVLEQVERVAPTDSTVLIQGETGTGKELIAQAIHNVSARCGRALIKLNCAAIPLDLLESELFGHERGAFAGAITVEAWASTDTARTAYLVSDGTSSSAGYHLWLSRGAPVFIST